MTVYLKRWGKTIKVITGVKPCFYTLNDALREVGAIRDKNTVRIDRRSYRLSDLYIETDNCWE